jgi:hypothetical protein
MEHRRIRGAIAKLLVCRMVETSPARSTKLRPRNGIEILRKQRAAIMRATVAPITLNHGVLPGGPSQMAASVFCDWRCVMRVLGGHWLEHDPIALAALVVGIAIVMLVVLSF